MAYPTKTELKAWLGISGSSEDTLLDQLLAYAVDYAERTAGRVFVSTTETRKFSLGYVTQRGKRLNLFCDLVSVTTLTNADDTVLTASQYELVDVAAPYYAIRIPPSAGVVFSGVVRDYVTVAGVWGWSSTPEGIFNAILEIAAATYRARVSGSAPVGVAQGGGLLISQLALPPLAVDTIRSFRRFRL